MDSTRRQVITAFLDRMAFSSDKGSSWRPCTRLSIPERGTVSVLRYGIDQAAPYVSAMSRLLSQDEVARAHRFVFPYLRDRYIAGRAGMRIALGLMLGVPPAALQFSYGDKGKPHLAYPDPQFDFNLSHTGELALLAVSRAGRIGVDIEKVDKRIEHTEIATAFFSPAERMALSEFEPADRAAAFFRCWTRKEAIIKALGDGLSLPLDQFDVTLSDELRLLSLFSDTNPRHWSLFDLRPEPEMAAAVAVEGTVKSLQTLSWDPVAALPLWA